jgi:hypothetical protein
LLKERNQGILTAYEQKPSDEYARKIGEIYRASAESASAQLTWRIALGIFGGIYLLSFGDLIGTYYMRRKNYVGARRERSGKVPGPLKITSERRTEQVSTIGQAKNPTNKLKRSVQRLLAWNKSPAFIRVIGILPFLLFLFLNSSLTSGLADLFASLSIVWFLVVVFIAERIAKLENSGSVSTEKELKPPKTITK